MRASTDLGLGFVAAAQRRSRSPRSVRSAPARARRARGVVENRRALPPSDLDRDLRTLPRRLDLLHAAADRQRRHAVGHRDRGDADSALLGVERVLSPSPDLGDRLVALDESRERSWSRRCEPSACSSTSFTISSACSGVNRVRNETASSIEYSAVIRQWARSPPSRMSEPSPLPTRGRAGEGGWSRRWPWPPRGSATANRSSARRTARPTRSA